MTQTDEITQAIAAHGVWRARLQAAIQAGRTVDGRPVKALHAQLHREASVVLAFALEGREEETPRSMDMGGSFFRASANLAAQRMSWKAKLSKG